MNAIDRALSILARAEGSPMQWERAADQLRGLCHTEAGVACPSCRGAGTRVYGSGSTWRGGMGVAAMTQDVCDVCWGTGRSGVTGVDLRALTTRLSALERAQGATASCAWLAAQLGVEFTHVRAILPSLATRLRRLRGVEFWTAQLCDRLAGALETMAAVSKPETTDP